MRNFKYVIISLLTVLAACLLPISANAINLYENPQDNAKVIGTIDLAAGIIPIYTPQNGLWMKVGDPKNGNTGWIKSSELKDSNGKILSVSQTIREGNNGNNVQSMEMTYGKPLTPEQRKMMQDQLLQQQNNAAKSMMMIQQNLEDVKQLYKQQVDLMQKIGFPVVPGMGTTPAKATPGTTNQSAPQSVKSTP